ncbi:MAG: PspC domain-containing protein [Propionicimonas sp.]
MSLPVRRTRDHAMIAGVCAGLASRWNVDANLLRIAVAILALGSGLGVILYGAAYLLIPVEGSTQAPARRLLPFTRDWPDSVLVAATAAAGAILFGLLGGWSGIGFFPILAIAAVWYFGVFRPRSHTHTPSAPETTPYERAAEAWRLRLLEHQTRGATSVGADGNTEPALAAPPLAAGPDAGLRFFGDPVVESGGVITAASPVPPRRRLSLWWLAGALITVGASIVGILASLGIGAGLLPYLAVVLLGLGATLVVATRRGRPRFMLAAAAATILATVAGLAFGGVGISLPSRNIVVSSEAELPARIESDLSDLTIDLTRLDTLSGDRTTTIDLSTGSLQVMLPKAVNTEVSWQVKAGRFHGVGADHAGVDLVGVETHTPQLGGPTLRLRVTVEAGNLEVTG